jgi:hypothetical protein
MLRDMTQVRADGAQKSKKASGVPEHTPFDATIKAASEKYGVPVDLIKAVIKKESAFKPGATSPCGAAGLMQMMPGTARDMGVTDRYDPTQSIMGGTKYLAGMLRRYHGDIPKALAAYNAGPGTVDKAIRNGNPGGIPNIRETKNYVATIMSWYTGGPIDEAILNSSAGARERGGFGGSSRSHERVGVQLDRPRTGKDFWHILMDSLLQTEAKADLAGMTEDEMIAFLKANNPELEQAIASGKKIGDLVVNLTQPLLTIEPGLTGTQLAEILASQARKSLLGPALKGRTDEQVVSLLAESNPELKQQLDKVTASGPLAQSAKIAISLDVPAVAPDATGIERMASWSPAQGGAGWKQTA